MKADGSCTYTQEPNYSNKHPYKNRPNYAYCPVYIRSLVRRICLQYMHFGLSTLFSNVGRDSSVRVATGHGLRGTPPPEFDNFGGGEVFCVRPDLPYGPPSLLYNGYGVFPGVKAAGAWG